MQHFHTVNSMLLALQILAKNHPEHGDNIFTVQDPNNPLIALPVLTDGYEITTQFCGNSAEREIIIFKTEEHQLTTTDIEDTQASTKMLEPFTSYAAVMAFGWSEAEVKLAIRSYGKYLCEPKMLIAEVWFFGRKLTKAEQLKYLSSARDAVKNVKEEISC